MRKRLLGAGVLAVLIPAVLLISFAAAGEEPATKKTSRIVIRDVIISGNRQISTEQIKAHLRTHAGDEYNLATLNHDVGELYKMHEFSNVQAVKQEAGAGTVNIYFLVTELPVTIQKVTFRGAKHIKEEEMLNLTGIHPGQLLNPDLNRQACRAIEEKYEEMGRPFAHCQLVKGAEPGDAEVVFDITEGPKVKVRDIQFVGNTFIDSVRLLEQLQSHYQWLACVGGTYSQEMADSDINTLTEHYRKQGFMDVKVSLETQRSSDGSEVTLIFHIEEGPRYHIKDIPESVGPKSPSAEEKRPDRVGQIFVIGNTQTSTESILAHIPLCPGQILSESDLRQAEKTLAELGLFVVDPAKGVRPTITVRAADSDSAYKDIVIEVQEKRTKRQSR
jgi:outer membrane protein insertion porin family